MEQNNQNRRSYSNERNTNNMQDRYNQGYDSFRNDNDYDAYRNQGDQFNRSNNDFNNQRSYGSDYNRGGDINENGWNNWSNRYPAENAYGQTENDRNSNYNRDSRDYNRGSYNSSRDFDSFNSGNYGMQNDRRSHQDFNRNMNRSGNYNQDRFSQGNNDNNRNNDYGRFNQSQDYGRRNFNDFSNRGSRFDYQNQQGSDNDRGWWDRTRDEVSSWFGDDDAQRRREMDQRMDQRYDQRQSHRGKGPKDYSRSSDRIREDISDRLSDSHDVDASEISVKVEGNEVTLSGFVNTKAEKRRAEDIAESVSGITHVQNNIRVGIYKSEEGGQDRNATSYGAGTSTATATEKPGLGTSSSTTNEKSKSTKNEVKPEKANLS